MEHVLDRVFFPVAVVSFLAFAKPAICSLGAVGCAGRVLIGSELEQFLEPLVVVELSDDEFNVIIGRRCLRPAVFERRMRATTPP